MKYKVKRYIKSIEKLDFSFSHLPYNTFKFSLISMMINIFLHKFL